VIALDHLELHALGCERTKVVAEWRTKTTRSRGPLPRSNGARASIRPMRPDSAAAAFSEVSGIDAGIVFMISARPASGVSAVPPAGQTLHFVASRTKYVTALQAGTPELL
jgi:hypothetical protein